MQVKKYESNEYVVLIARAVVVRQRLDDPISNLHNRKMHAPGPAAFEGNSGRGAEGADLKRCGAGRTANRLQRRLNQPPQAPPPLRRPPWAPHPGTLPLCHRCRRHRRPSHSHWHLHLQSRPRPALQQVTLHSRLAQCPLQSQPQSEQVQLWLRSTCQMQFF